MAERFDYSHYEFSLRDREWNREALAEYVVHFQDCQKVLDLACGSGIFLELLAEKGIPAVGVERNPDVATWGKQQGWEVVEQDVFAFLEQTEETYEGIFCSHFLEHLPFTQVLRVIELLALRVSAAGTVVIVVPNPESIRMQLFGFWRDPEHIRFYHPELLEAVCTHVGLEITYTNREDIPFALAPPAFPPVAETVEHHPSRRRSWWKDRMRAIYFQLLRLFRITPYPDLLAAETRMLEHLEAQRTAVSTWAEKTNEAVNRMWAWPDDVCIVCRKPQA